MEHPILDTQDKVDLVNEIEVQTGGKPAYKIGDTYMMPTGYTHMAETLRERLGVKEDILYGHKAIPDYNRHEESKV